jgi:hypothetical protein
MRRSFFTRFRLFLNLLVIFALCLLGSTLLADDPPADKKEEKAPDIAPPTARELADRRMQFMKTVLGRFTIQVGERKEPATVGDPCLRWTNPIGGAPDGIIAVYAHKGGRPAAIGQFLLNGQKKWLAEFTIIPESDVTIRRAGRLFWKPSEYVCKFTDLPHSPQPADKPALRLTQMRAIAADFTVIDYFKEIKQELRLLRQPVYRYLEKGEIWDGAVFIFVVGTDPECCVLVEAYQDNAGSRYRYAVAPMTTFQLEAHYKDRLVWEIDRRPVAGAGSRAYYSGVYTPEPGETLPE